MRGSALVGRAARGLRSFAEGVSGHLWTAAPVAAALVRPLPLPAASAWSATLSDPDLGPIPLSGALHQSPSASTDVVVVVHGLGGEIDSPYMRSAAHAAHAAGLACLRLNLRGADHSGEDYYHAGLTADLHAALGSAALAPFRRILLLGYSLGGHLVLRFATEPHDERVAAVAAVCAPLDLDASANDIDQPQSWPYRHYLLAALRDMIRAVARRRELPLPLAEALSISRIRSWDDRVIAPRFGFRDAADYYASVSVGPLLGAIERPTLIVSSRHDPMVRAAAVAPALRGASAPIAVRWLERGAGHVGFAATTHLGEAAPPGLEPQVIAWLRGHLR